MVGDIEGGAKNSAQLGAVLGAVFPRQPPISPVGRTGPVKGSGEDLGHAVKFEHNDNGSQGRLGSLQSCQRAVEKNRIFRECSITRDGLLGR